MDSGWAGPRSDWAADSLVRGKAGLQLGWVAITVSCG